MTLLCRLGLHAWIFSYAPHGTAYRPDVCCLRCVAAPSPRHVRLRAILCAADVHRGQALTAPPTWRQGDPREVGRFCIFCAGRLAP